MIFKKDGVDAGAIDEFRLDVPFLDKKTEFELLVPEIGNAEYELRKIIGNSVYERAEAEYLAYDGEIDAEDAKLFRYVQAVIANIAFRDYTLGNDLRHTVTGRKAVVNPAHEKQAWEFFIERDNESLNFKIQKSLNRLIDYLNRNEITEWVESKVFRIKHQVLLPDIDVFCRYYPIDNSLALFNQLLPFQLEMQRKYIAPLVGQELLTDMLAAVFTDNIDSTATDELSGSGSGVVDESILTLIDYAGPALALWTMATGIKRLSVKLLPEGLVQQFRSSVQSRQSSFNVNAREKDLIVASLIRDAQEATSMLENQIKIRDAVTTETVVTATSYLADRNVSTNKYFSM